MFKVGDLFAGIGGFSLGLEWAGMQTAWQVEKDEFCRKVLAKHWPNVPRHEDIFDFIELCKGGEIEQPDVIAGGFPCQPFSQAGQRKSTSDDRYLWPAMLEVISLLRPTWVIGENVAGIVRLALDQVLSDLEDEGYSTQAFIIPAAGVGAPHRRERVWIVANSKRSASRERNDKWTKYFNDNRKKVRTFNSSSRKAVAHSKITRAVRGKRAQTDATKQDGGGTGPRDVQWWQSEPNVGRVASGVPRRVDRLRALGNAVVPQIPYVIGQAILEAEDSPRHKRNDKP